MNKQPEVFGDLPSRLGGDFGFGGESMGAKCIQFLEMSV